MLAMSFSEFDPTETSGLITVSKAGWFHFSLAADSQSARL